MMSTARGLSEEELSPHPEVDRVFQLANAAERGQSLTAKQFGLLR